jgi:hypothetical protein
MPCTAIATIAVTAICWWIALRVGLRTNEIVAPAGQRKGKAEAPLCRSFARWWGAPSTDTDMTCMTARRRVQ